MKRKREEEGGIDGGWWWWAEVKEEMWDGRWAVGLGGKRVLSGGWFGRRANRDEWLVDTCPVARPSPNPNRTESCRAGIYPQQPGKHARTTTQCRTSAEQVQNEEKLTEIDIDRTAARKAPVSASQRRKDASSNNLGPLGINAVTPHQKSIAALSGTYGSCAPMGTCIYKLHIQPPIVQPSNPLRSSQSSDCYDLPSEKSFIGFCRGFACRRICCLAIH